MPEAEEKSDLPLRAKDGAYLLGAVCVVAAAFSAACAVMAGLRAAESRRQDGE